MTDIIKLAGLLLALWALLLWSILAAATVATAEVCKRKVDSSITKLSGFRWQHRDVDGQRCWYYARTPLPKEDLVWAFDEREFNSDVDRVIERKFYRRDLDADGNLIERKDED